MHPDSWDHMTKKDRARYEREVKQYPCEECASRYPPHNPTTCRTGFDLDGEHPGCSNRKQWWKPMEAPR